MKKIFDKNCLLRALKSEYEVIAIWGAYQIMQLKDSEIKEYLSLFLQSPFFDIQDTGIIKIAEIKDEAYVQSILKIFRESDGQIKYSAVYALSQFPNDFSRSLIKKWFEQLSLSDQFTRLEFESATFAYLQIGKNENFPVVMNLLNLSQQDAIKSSVLFSNLLMFCETEKDYKTILDQYFILRDINSDAELTYQMIEFFGQNEIRDWWVDNLSKGYSISSVYEQCYILLDQQENILDRQYWLEIEHAFGNYNRFHPTPPKDHQAFFESLGNWIDVLTNNSHQNEILKWVVDSFRNNQNLFLKTIPKILEMECHFLLTIPLLIIVEKSITKWLDNPYENVENIATYYHSSLLFKNYREKILNLFFPNPPDWSIEQLKIKNEYSPLQKDDSRREILWAFYREELLGFDIPWPSIFPNPNYSSNLAEGLWQIYFTNFDYYINKRDLVAVDYALQLFQSKPEKEIIDLIAENFDYLNQFHSDILYQTIEYIPDPTFKDLLLKKYQKEEYELAKLIFVICEIFDLPVPEIIIEDIKDLQSTKLKQSGVKKPIRLHCQECDNTYQYSVDTIYVDEGAILRMNKLNKKSIWVSQKFNCKKCSSPINFVLDDVQLNEFSSQSRVDRILNFNSQSNRNHFGHRIILIDFPRYDAETYTPDEFIQFVATCEQNRSFDKNKMELLWTKLAQMYKSIHQWEACLNVLKKFKPDESYEFEWFYTMGLVHYKMEQFNKSREFFDWIIKKAEHEVNLPSINHKVEQSRFFLKTMDSDASKRARLKLITGKNE